MQAKPIPLFSGGCSEQTVDEGEKETREGRREWREREGLRAANTALELRCRSRPSQQRQQSSAVCSDGEEDGNDDDGDDDEKGNSTSKKGEERERHFTLSADGE